MKYVYGKNEALEPVDRDAYIYRLKSAYSELGSLVKERRFHKTLLIYDTAVRESRVLKEVEESFQRAEIESVRYEEITAEACFRVINDGYNRCLLTGCDSVLCVGGKAAIDVGKGINMLRFNGGTIEKYTDPMARRNTGSGLFCVCCFDGSDEERILTLKVWDTEHQNQYTVECYCNYDVKPCRH